MPWMGWARTSQPKWGGPPRAAERKQEQENDSHHWCQRECWQSGFAGSDPEGVQGPGHVQVKRGSRESAFGMRACAGGLCRQTESAQGPWGDNLRIRGVLSDSTTRGTGEQYGGGVQGIRREACGAEFGAWRGRLCEIVSELAPQGGRQAQGDGNELHDPAAQWVSAEYRGL